MTDPGKRKLSAKQILADIRSGMDSSGLKAKYGLSDKGLEAVCSRLTSTGSLTETEIRRFGTWRGSSQTSPGTPKRARWQCPACNTPQKVEMSECPVCGIVVEKFMTRQGQVGRASTVASSTSGDTGPTERKGWMWVVMSVVVFALAGSSLLVWSTHKGQETPRISKMDGGSESLQRDPAESGQAQEGSAEPGSAEKDYTEVEVDDSQHTGLPSAQIAPMPRETPSRAVAAPREETPPPTAKPQYVTGELRRFSSRDFKKEVVEASKTYPVVLQFYNQT